MAEAMGHGILRWLERRCTGRRLRAGSRQRDRLLRRVGRASGIAAGHRLPSGTWKAHGAAAYRCFKWDPDQVPAETRALCRQLLALEARLSGLARQLGAGAGTPPSGHRPASACAPVPRAGGTLWHAAGKPALAQAAQEGPDAGRRPRRSGAFVAAHPLPPRQRGGPSGLLQQPAGEERR